MNSQTREIRHFFFSQYFSDGLRITLGILLPSLVFAHFNEFQTGLTLSLGALCVSITDTPGPVLHKRNAMLLCSLLIFVIAMLTGFARLYVWLLGLEVLLLSFLFSMFLVYGNRAAALGTSGLLVMILMMDTALTPAEVPGYSALIMAGGVWYAVLSLLFFQIRPYLAAQQALGECVHEVAKFLRIKADFYNTHTNLEDDYKKLVAQQVQVSEKQDAVREILFKTRVVVKESTHASRALLLTFVDLMDLYEQILANAFDYAMIRERFGNTGILPDVASHIRAVANELDNIGFAIQSNTRYRSLPNLNAQLDELKQKIDALERQGNTGSLLVLKKIMVNLRSLTQHLHAIMGFLNAGPANPLNKPNMLDYDRFVSHQSFDIKKIRENLTFNSSIFKHSFRVALVCFFGFLLTKFLAYGPHSYWVLLTIIVILKPGFSLTKQRNYERIVGTLIGGLIGVLVLAFVKDKTAQFILLLFLMVGTYSFQRVNYTISVIFMTPFVLILFSFMGVGGIDLVQERIVDTFIGAGIAFSASYFLFPSWESQLIKGFMQHVLKANSDYLWRIGELMTGKEDNILEYKLARKEVYVSSANLSAAFQRMLSEPRSKQWRSKEVHKFRVLTHVLSSSMAALGASVQERPSGVYAPDMLRSVRRSLHLLSESINALNPAAKSAHLVKLLPEMADQVVTIPEDAALQEHLDFIQKISSDILKVTEAATNPKHRLEV
ncbi:FUSC family protein [Pontibacter arcticus]|uniref:Uncharacterized protein n=1 Tax=Pontibacter arcticus TaxID=2080288 RepID=A0A364RCF8_9BACT|nr:FUSC family membrane protein [Pontibacter arcticus]RAU82040.1 hypothetical protein DP923_13970 [Pontibacter arcticus]